MSLKYSFAGKRVLVTGGGSGIGRQLVGKLYEDGAIVFTIDKNPEALKKLKEELPGGNLTAKVCDIGNWEETRKIVEGFGVMDHLVNCAAILASLSFLNVTEEDLTKHYKVNLFGLVNVSQVVAKGMIKSGKSGAIVNIASTTARMGMPELTSYASSKAAVVNLSKSMAVELGAHNIRVNCVLPNLVETPMQKGFSQPLVEAIPAILERNINKRQIAPEEVADLVLFLLSPLSTMIIGGSIVIDGGFGAS